MVLRSFIAGYSIWIQFGVLVSETGRFFCCLVSCMPTHLVAHFVTEERNKRIEAMTDEEMSEWNWFSSVPFKTGPQRKGSDGGKFL